MEPVELERAVASENRAARRSIIDHTPVLAIVIVSLAVTCAVLGLAWLLGVGQPEPAREPSGPFPPAECFQLRLPGA